MNKRHFYHKFNQDHLFDMKIYVLNLLIRTSPKSNYGYLMCILLRCYFEFEVDFYLVLFIQINITYDLLKLFREKDHQYLNRGSFFTINL